jgi:3-oxoacyl-[acyl-carrier-protein] synthase II
VSSTKGATGHMLGAAGAFEALVTLLAIRKGQIPPTLNLQTPDAEEDVDLVPLKARERRVDVALSNSFGFAGQNASLVLTAE